MTSKKTEPALFLDMDFGEALARYAQTKPEEVTPPPGAKKKAARPAPKNKPGQPD
ncbi:hypothetical protein [Caulobacter sp. DWR2-3-1b2]|uniref:hypothetical protein n=1 Tax=unclassified Caulobacter TaxID=2648921 RepID=UPI003CF5FC0E